jgi:hypothetical protein
MGRRSRMRAAVGADLAVTVLGVAGLLGFLMAGRMDDANAFAELTQGRNAKTKSIGKSLR